MTPPGLDDAQKHLMDLVGNKSGNSSNLDYTTAQFADVRKMIKPSESANQVLRAFIDFNSRERSQDPSTTARDEEETASIGPSDFKSISSCYSSSGSHLNQSLECLRVSDSCNISDNLRKIYIDGPNVAKSHGRDEFFSWLGIKISVDWFLARNHKVKALVPEENCQSAPPEILGYLKASNTLITTPSGCNDDLFIIEAARKSDGVIVSNDLFRDEKRSNSELERFIHLNRLPFIFDDDSFIPASDPHGRSGLFLDDFLRVNRKNSHKSLHLIHPKSSYRRNGSLVKQRVQNPNSMSRRSLQGPRDINNRLMHPLITLEGHPSDDLIACVPAEKDLIDIPTGTLNGDRSQNGSINGIGKRRRAIYGEKNQKSNS